jgi:threonine dehydrogenase-like Zn-dependent dehydrogenase
MIARGGKISIVGLYGQPFPVSPSGFGHDVSLINCGLRWDLPAAVRLMKEGKVNAKPLISHQFPLEKVKEAFDTASSAPDAIKVVVNITK